LRRLRRHDAAADGIYEEFLQCRLGSGVSLPLVSGPLGKPHDEAWVVCPSIGPEHGNLRRLEAMVARRLSAEGYPVLRIRPDVHPHEGLGRGIDLDARLREIDDGIRLLSTELGARTAGLVGPFFGGTVAALACDRLGLSSMILIEPVPRGKRYIKEIVRRHAVAELVRIAEELDPTETLAPHRFEDDGSTTIQGMRLSAAEAERISEVDLLSDVGSFHGRSLLIGITPSGELSKTLRGLRDHLAALGGDVTTAVLQDELYAPFGEYYYRNAGPVRLDTRLELDGRVAETVACWALGRAVDAALAAGT
jgi:pimeloyl-ACP methyl ester carboxylesterase